jgi:VIT1/CCC1 family predicted Fe2+/Mn2+ transporter
MSNTVYNERVKLLAAAFNSAAVSSFGVIAPVAAMFYGVGTHAAVIWMAIGAVILLFVAIALHLGARHVLGGLTDDAE